MTAKPATTLSLRREAGFVLAIAILLLSILSIVTLATHRSALDTLRAEQISRWRRDVATLERRVDAGVRPADLVAQTPGLLDLERSRVDPVDDEANVAEGDENGAVRLSARLSLSLIHI